MYKLLIIDDDKSMTQPVKCFFKRKNYSVDVAHTGEDGINCIRENRPDIVLLDIGLPDISGIEVLGKIRETGSDIKVVMMTGYNTDEKINKAQKLGISDYVQKPLRLKHLGEKMDKIAGGSE